MANQVPGMGSFLQAVQIFNQEMTRTGVQRAIQKANEEASRIRAQELADVEKQAQLNQVAQNLQLGILGAGGNAATAQTSAEAFQGPAPPRPQTPFQAFAFGTPEQQEAAQEFVAFEAKQNMMEFAAKEGIKSANQGALEQRKFQNQVKLAEIKAGQKLTKEQEKKERQSNQDVLKQLDTFNKLTSGIRKSEDAVASVNALLAGAKDPEAAQFAASELAKIGLVKASGESGRLSDQDLERAAGNPNLFRQTKRFLMRIARGVPPTEDVDEMRKLVEVAQKGLQVAKERRAESFAKQRAPLIGLDPREFKQQLLTGIGRQAEEAPQYNGINQFLKPLGPATTPNPASTIDQKQQATQFLTPKGKPFVGPIRRLKPQGE